MALHNETASAAAEVPQRPHYILSDEAILSLSDDTMFMESEPLFGAVEDGKLVGGFWYIAGEVATAIENVMKSYYVEVTETGSLQSWQTQAVFAMRAFYLLGVLRGGEAYRNSVSAIDMDPEYKDIPFQLEPLAAADFVDDLNIMPIQYLNDLLALLGLTVPWAAEDQKGGPEA